MILTFVRLCLLALRALQEALRTGQSNFARLHMLWWRHADSNRRPSACKADALPTELCPHWEPEQSGKCEKAKLYVATSLGEGANRAGISARAEFKL